MAYSSCSGRRNKVLKVRVTCGDENKFFVVIAEGEGQEEMVREEVG